METSDELDISSCHRDVPFINEGFADSEETAVVGQDIVLILHVVLGGDVNEVLQDPRGVVLGR
jgi:hypothetical protein